MCAEHEPRSGHGRAAKKTVEIKNRARPMTARLKIKINSVQNMSRAAARLKKKKQEKKMIKKKKKTLQKMNRALPMAVRLRSP